MSIHFYIIFLGQASPVKLTAVTPTKSGNLELKDDLTKFYKDTGLESYAKEVDLVPLTLT